MPIIIQTIITATGLIISFEGMESTIEQIFLMLCVLAMPVGFVLVAFSFMKRKFYLLVLAFICFGLTSFGAYKLAHVEGDGGVGVVEEK